MEKKYPDNDKLQVTLQLKLREKWVLLLFVRDGILELARLFKLWIGEKRKTLSQ